MKLLMPPSPLCTKAQVRAHALTCQIAAAQIYEKA